jgi:phenylacetate-coenzyme A ligase PaaK-like adenylate-forming protein/uncharacterized protein (DUF362 family)
LNARELLRYVGLRHLLPLASRSLRGVPASYRRNAALFHGRGGSLAAVQEHRLRDLVRFAAAATPFYRDRLREAAFRFDAPSYALELRKVPPLTKAELQQHGSALTARGSRAGWTTNASGGSTGHPVALLQDGPYRTEMKATEWLSDELQGWRAGAPVALLWGAPSDTRASKLLRARVHRFFTNGEVFDSFDMGPDRMARFHARLQQLRPRVLIAYAGSAFAYARFLLEAGLRPHYPTTSIITSAETLTAEMRETIERCFAVPVFNRYGSREVGCIGSECAAHVGLHLHPYNHLVEVVDLDTGEPVVGRPGRILVTLLTNRAMPLIRYDIGDVGVLGAAPCPCGRPSPLLEKVLGRSSDFILAPDGRLVHGEYFTHLFYGRTSIRQFQFVQETPTAFTLRVVRSPASAPGEMADVEAGIREVLGPRARIAVEELERIPPAPSGKHRFTISKLDLATAVRAGRPAGGAEDVPPDPRSDPRVAIEDVAPYGRSAEAADERAFQALVAASKQLGWFDPERGPLAGVVARGSRVLIKPNLVLHRNAGGWDFDAVVTHPSFIHAAVRAALMCGPARVQVGDAPIQGCDFEALLRRTGLARWAAGLARSEAAFAGIKDFRRTTCTFVRGVRRPTEERVPEDEFRLFDLGASSLLEPISDARGSFRVTCYDPRLLARTHAPGRHQYLVAREVVDADVVINLPKLKMHKKAGITCALKNLVGINGNKEYLPHHRVGGAATGGDCYPGRSWAKQALEAVLDVENRSRSFALSWASARAAAALRLVLHARGDRVGVEGSWSGNDTVWGMCLDLNRILLYGRSDGTIAQRPARRVVHFVDGVVAGQGDGPLAPEPLPLGVAMLGGNAAAVDWVGARLLGLDPQRITLVREAFGLAERPLAEFAAGDVRVVGEHAATSPAALLRRRGIAALHYPEGWKSCGSVGVDDLGRSGLAA